MRKLKLYSLLIILALSLSLPTTLAQRKGGTAKPTRAAALMMARGVDTISADQLKNYLYFIASDEMEGRDTPSRGLDTTAKFIAMNLTRWGFKPAGDDGTFFQRIALRRDQLDGPRSTAEINGQKFSFGDDFLPNTVAATFTGPLVYVGNGWIVKSKNIDAYQGVDVKGKITVVLGQGFPKGVTTADLRSGTAGVDWLNPVLYAQQHGALGVLTIADAALTQNWEQQRQRLMQPARASVEKFQTNAPVSTVTMSIKMANALFEGEKFDAATIISRAQSAEPVAAFDLNSSKTVNITIAVKPDHPTTQNLVGVSE